jgi:F-type H+-transporting ATPase subunit delta
MFVCERWAAAFINSQGPDAGEGLECLKILASWVKNLPGAVFGSSAAKRLENLVREQAEKTGSSLALEKAVRITALLVRKNLFRHIDAVVRETEKILDQMQGIVPVTLESAHPLDGAAEAGLREAVKKRAGVKEVKLEKRINPGLIGGYRLRIGDEIVDASVCLQLREMAAALADGGGTW